MWTVRSFLLRCLIWFFTWQARVQSHVHHIFATFNNLLGCWFNVGGDNLTGAPPVTNTTPSPVTNTTPSPLTPKKSRMKSFWCQLTRDVLENGRQTSSVVVENLLNCHLEQTQSKAKSSNMSTRRSQTSNWLGAAMKLLSASVLQEIRGSSSNLYYTTT